MKPTIFFKRVIRLILPVEILILAQTGLAQTVPTTQVLPDTAKMTYNQISQQMKLYVFPAKGQSKEQQKKDEFECYKWAEEQSGIDPLNLPKVEAAPVQSGPTGGAVIGAAKGGVGTITVNGKKVAEKRLEKTQPGIFSADDMADVGVDDGTHVADYGASAKFNGKINYVTDDRNK